MTHFKRKQDWFVATLLIVTMSGVVRGDDRPNILWISCEDISPNLGCYGDPHAITPNLDRLASQGVRFDLAFTPAGVCAVVRSAVITGMYPPSIGSHHMRSQIIPPANVKAFAEILRAAGYFTTNRSKTDYQFEPTPSIWNRQGADHQDWRERPDPEQPFFSVVNFTVCHESQIRHGAEQHAKVIAEIGEETRRDPIGVADTIPDYLPNTAATRENWAYYHDNITLMDKMAGEVLERLQQDGLADNTLVVFWSDHGMGMPRGKRWVYDSGILVPMIFRWPGKLRAGSVREDLVSVLDLPPTMLRAAEIEVPRYMHGRVLIGDRADEEPRYLFFHRDRMDEAFELQRAVRDRRWKYIRNYQIETPYSQPIEYMDQMPAMQDWRRWAAAGRLGPGQRNWFATPKPIEELYDTENDPWELNNLASRPQYAERLQRMREATEVRQKVLGDLGMVPEAVLMEEMKPGGETPKTQPPIISRAADRLMLNTTTEGASIVYRLQQIVTADADADADQQASLEAAWGEWTLYTKSIRVPPSATRIRAQASRLGFTNSQVVDQALGERLSQ